MVKNGIKVNKPVLLPSITLIYYIV
jgi:hypothetical protein